WRRSDVRWETIRLSVIRWRITFKRSNRGGCMIGRRMKLCLAVTLVASMAASSAIAAAPSMSMNWVSFTTDQDDCVKRASSAMRKNGFKTRFEVINSRSIYGERGDYTGAVRCVADKSVAFVAVAGPKGDQTEKYAKAIQDDF